MKLYHGTSSEHLMDILKNGIRPRGIREGNWEKCPSRPDCVYLTDAYGFFYAGSTIDDKGTMCIIEVDVPTDGLLPDEDFVEQAMRHDVDTEQDPDYNVLAATWAIRDNLEAYRKYWDASLLGLGNVAYQATIQPHQITRYALVDDTAFLMAFDPVICLANYGLMGAYYRNSMKWLFDPKAEFEEDMLGRSDAIREMPRINIKVIPDEFGKDE